MPAIPIIAAVVTVGGGIAAAKINSNAQKNAQQQSQAASAQSTQAYRQQQMDAMFGGGEGGQTSPYSRNYDPTMGGPTAPAPGPGYGGMYPQPGQGGQVQTQGQNPGPYQGTYTQEGDQKGMFHNADGSIDWQAGTGPAWLQNSPQYQRSGQAPLGQRPPSPDSVADRGTQKWRDAYNKEQNYIKLNEDAGRSLSDLGLDPTKGGGMSNYMRWGDYKADPTALKADQAAAGGGGGSAASQSIVGLTPEGDPIYGPGGSGGGGSSSSSYGTYLSPLGDGSGGPPSGDYGLSGYYGGLLGNAQASSAYLAPQMQALQEQKDGQVQSIMASMPPGGQRDRAISQLNQSFSSSLGQLRQGLVPQALSGLQNLYGTQLSNETQRYGIDTSAATSRYGIDVGAQTAAGQLGLGYANLGQQGYQYDQNLDMQKLNYLTGSSQWDQNFNAQQQAYQNQQNQQKWGGVTGTITGLAGAYLNNRQNRVNYGGGSGSQNYNYNYPSPGEGSYYGTDYGTGGGTAMW